MFKIAFVLAAVFSLASEPVGCGSVAGPPDPPPHIVAPVLAE